MGDNETRAGLPTGANPEPNAHHNYATDCTVSDAPAFVFGAWRRWRLGVSEAHELGVKPHSQAALAARAIFAEWHIEGRHE